MKTYGTYTDSSGNTRDIDEFHMHELLDRTHVIRGMFSDFIEDHPAEVLVRKDVQEIAKLISRLYQKIGDIEFGKFSEK